MILPGPQPNAADPQTTPVTQTFGQTPPSGSGNPPFAGFTIDASSGQISYSGTGVNREAQAGFAVSLVVVASSIGADGSATKVYQPVSVSVTDVDEGDATVTVAGSAWAGRGTLRFDGLSGDPDGDPADRSGFTYVWQTSAAAPVSWSAVSGQTESTYAVRVGDTGRLLRLGVSYTDAGGTDETVFSAPVTVAGAGQLTATARVVDRVAFEGSTTNVATVSVSLDGALAAGEVVTVPLTLTGAGDPQFSLALASNPPTGAVLSGAGELVLTGPFASTVTVEVSAETDSDDVAEVLTLGVGTVTATGASLAGADLAGVVAGDPRVVLAEPVASRRVDVAVSAPGVVEGASAVVEVSLRGGPLTTGVTVPLTVSGAGSSEYRLASSVTIPAGSWAARVLLDAVDDGTAESPELWTVSVGVLGTGLSHGRSAILGVTDASTLRPVDDSLAVTLVATDPVAVENSSDNGLLRVRLEPRALASGESLVVPLRFAGGVLGTDFGLVLQGNPTGVSYANGSVTFAGAGALEARFAVTALSDADTVGEVVTVSAGSLSKTAITEDASWVSFATFVLNDASAVGAPVLPADAGVVAQLAALTGTAREDTPTTGASLRVRLSRALADGEKLVVPLKFGGGTVGEDFSLAAAGTPRGWALSGSTVTFTGPSPTDANLRVTALQDADGVSETVDAAIGPVAATGVTGTVLAQSRASVRVVDDDTSAVRVTAAAGGLTVSEPSGTAAYTIALASRPTHPVTVTPTVAPGSAVTVSGPVTIAPADWVTPVTVTVTAADDSTDTPARTATVTHVTSSTDPDFNEATVASVTVTVEDDDATVVSLARVDSGGIDEAGATAADRQMVFTVSLGRALVGTEKVLVPLVFSGSGITGDDFGLSLDTSGGRSAAVALSSPPRLQATTLTFSAGSQVAHVVLEARADSLDEPAETLTAALGSQEQFDALTATNVAGGAAPHATTRSQSVTVADGDDPLRVTLTSPDGASPSLDEGDASSTARLTLTLSRALVAGQSLSVPLVFDGGSVGEDVALSLSGNPTGVTLAAATGVVRFAGPSDTTATVVVTAADDGDSVNESIGVTIPTAATGMTYEGLAATLTGQVSGTITLGLVDDDAAIGLSTSTLGVVEGGTATYTVRLASRPAGSVIVVPSSSDPSVVSVSGSLLLLTPQNWDQDQTVTYQGRSVRLQGQPVTVTAARSTQNEVDDPAGSRTATITHTVTPLNPADNGLVVGEVKVLVVDDDPTPVSIRLASPPGTVDPAAVLETGGTGTVEIVLGRTLAAGEQVSVPLDIGGTATLGTDYTLALSTTSGHNTGVTVSSGKPLTGADPVIVFAAGASVATLVLTPTGDTTAESPDETVGIALGSQSEFDSLNASSIGGAVEPVTEPDPDSGIAGATRPQQVELKILDDDATTAAVVVGHTGSGTTVVEADTAGDTYTVRLATQPSGDVTVTAAAPAGLQVQTTGAKGSSAALTFTTTNWRSPQGVTVTATDDSTDSPSRRTLNVTHTVSGYGSVSAGPAAAVTVLDDDATVVSVTGGGTVEESDPTVSASVTVRLSRALAAGEVVEVPLALRTSTGVALSTRRAQSALAWQVSGTGASVYADPGALNRGPTSADVVVRLAGAGARTAVLTFTATGVDTHIETRVVAGRRVTSVTDGDDEDEAVQVSLSGSISATARDTNLDGGVTRDAANRSADLVIAEVSIATGNVASIADATAAEGDPVSFTVTLSEVAEANVTVPYTLSNGRGDSSDPDYSVATGSATGAGADYTNTAGTVVIAAGNKAGTISVPTTDDDDVYESDHYFTVTLSTPTQASGTPPGVSATKGSAVGTITDAADTPTFGIANADLAVVVNEDVGSATARVTLVGDSLVPATVDWTTAPVSRRPEARAGEDYTAASGTVSFAAGATAATVSVDITDDTADEHAERFYVSFTRGTHAVNDPDRDDTDATTPVVSIAAPSGTAVEGTALVFTLTAAPAPTSDITVLLHVQAAGDVVAMADEGFDKQVTVGTSGRATFTLRTVDDDIDGSNGSVVVTVQDGPGYKPMLSARLRSRVTVDILDDEPTTVTLSRAAGASITEGSAIGYTLALGRPLTQASEEMLTVPLAITGTAVRGTDYTIACEAPLPAGVTCSNLNSGSPSIVFAAPSDEDSARSVALTVTATADSLADSGETLDVGMGTLAAVELDGGTTSVDDAGLLFIDDPATGTPVASITADATQVTEGAAVAFTVRVNEAPTSNLDVTVTVGETTGDYVLPAGEGDKTVTIPANGRSATLTVMTEADSNAEPDGAVTAALKAGTGYTLSSQGSAQTAVRDDDDPNAVTVTLSAAAGDIAEGSHKDITVSLDRALTGQEVVTVPLTIAGATATSGFTVALQPATQTGVTLVTSAPHSSQNPAVRLAAGASGAVLRFASVDNDRRSQPAVSIRVGADTRAPSAENAVLGKVSGGPFGFVITDDETGDIVLEADSPLVPSGLSAGDEFRLLWVTSAERDGQAAAIGVYDDFAQDLVVSNGLAALLPYGGLAAVLGSTATTDARDHTATTYTNSDKGDPVYWLNGDRVADDYEDFYDGTWGAQAHTDARTEAGANTGASAITDATVILTGSDSSGTEATISSLDRGLGRPRVAAAQFSNLDGTTRTPLHGSTFLDTQRGRLYVMSPVFTVAGTAAADAVFDAVPADLVIAENADGSTTAVTVGSPVTATDADGDPVTYSLEGPPSGSGNPAFAGFTIDASAGQISYTGTGVDREAQAGFAFFVPLVVVAASTGADGSATKVYQSVLVRVTDVDEGDATVTVSGLAQAGRGTLRFVSLSGDPDGDPATASGFSYQWQSSAASPVSWSAVSGATGSSYAVPVSATGRLLRLAVSYTDSAGTSEQAFSAPVTVVGVGRLQATARVVDRLAVEGATDTATVSVSLDTSLVTGEVVTVPLTLTGGSAPEFSLSLAADPPRGAVLTGAGALVLTGPFSSRVLVEVSAEADSDDTVEVLRLGVGTVTATGASLADADLAGAVAGDPTVVLAEPVASRAVDIAVSAPAVVEGASAVVEVSLRGGPLTLDVSIPLVVRGASAAEYRLTSPVTIPAGSWAARVLLDAVDDGAAESPELWTVATGTLPDGLTAGRSAVLGVTDASTLRPIDDGLAVTLVAVDPVAVEAGADNGLLRVRLEPRALAAGETLVVPLAFSGGVLGTDFGLVLQGNPTGVTYANGSVTFAGAGAREARFAVRALADSDRVSEVVTVSAGTLTKTSITEGTSWVSFASFVLEDTGSAGVPVQPAEAGVAVQLWALVDELAEGSRTADAGLRVRLSRELASGEKLVVPLVFSGATVGTDFRVAQIGPRRGWVVSGSTVTFTGPSASVANLSITALQDSNAVSESVAAAVGSVTATGVAGTVLTQSRASWRITDDDTSAIRVTGAAGGLKVSEPSGTATYEVSLASRPTQPVTITPTVAPGSAVTVSAAFTIAPADWATPVEVTVTAADDSADTPARTATVTHVTSSSDPAFHQATVPSLTVTVTDDDETVVALARVDSGGIAEDGATAADRQMVFTVSLGRALVGTEKVLVPLVFSGSGITGGDFELSLDTTNSRSTAVALSRARLSKQPGATLTFSAGAQVAHVVLTARADSLDEPAETLTAALGSQEQFDALTATNVAGGASPHATESMRSQTVAIADGDDPLVVTLSSPDGAAPSLDEGDDTDTARLTLTLSRALVAGQSLSVPLTFAGGNIGDDIKLSLSDNPTPTGVTLTATNGVVRFTGPSVATATVVVTAADDDDSINESIGVTIPTAATGMTYDGLANTLRGQVTGTITLKVVDDDAASGLSTSTLSVVEGGTATYTVRLASQPAGDVLVVPRSPDPSVVTVPGTLLLLTPQNWDQDQTVSYWAPGEDGKQVNRSVRVQGQPVTVTSAIGQNDVDDPSGSRTATITHTVTPFNSADIGLVVGEVKVLVVDDDPTPVSIRLGSSSAVDPAAMLETGGTGTVEIVLGRTLAAGEQVSVPLDISGSASLGTDYTLALSSASGHNTAVSVSSGKPLTGDDPVIVFAAGASVATLMLTPTGDTTDESPAETVSVALGSQAEFDTLNASSIEGGVEPVTEPDPDDPTATLPQSVLLKILDDDAATAAVIVDHVGGATTVVEADTTGDTYTVRLATQPSGDVRVTAAVPAGLQVEANGRKASSVSLTFTTVNWHIPQGVIVTALADSTDSPSRRVLNVTHTVSGYGSVSTGPSAAVTVLDDDATVVSVTGGGIVEEADPTVTASVTVRLSRALVAGEVAEVPVTVSSSTRALIATNPQRSALSWTASGAGVRVYADPITRRPPPTEVDLVVRFTGVGSQTATIAFAATGNDDDDTDERITVTVGRGIAAAARDTNVDGGVSAHGTDNAAQIVITDDSTPSGSRVSVADATAAEGDAVEFTVTLSEEATADVTVPYTLSDGRGVSSDPAYSVATSADYTNTAGSITITSGSNTGTISVATTQDSTYEGPHYFRVTLGTPTSSGTAPTVSPLAGTATGTVTDAADLPTVAVAMRARARVL